MALALGGLSVATTADLNAALGQIEDKLDSHRKWTENQIMDFILKLRHNTEKVDAMEREQATTLETMATDLKALRAGCVANTVFRQSVNQIEKRFDSERELAEGKLENTRIELQKDITSNISNLRLKAETLNANCIVLTEKSKVIDETLLPAIRCELEEQKQKRLSETQRLESEIEKVKEVADQKISHTAAALRFYVTATSTKLRDELTPATAHKELEHDLLHKEADLRKGIKSIEDMLASMRQELFNTRDYLDKHLEKSVVDMSGHTKTMKVMEINMANLQNSIATDIGDIREEVRNDVVKMKIEVADTRTTTSRSIALQENAINALSNEINPLRAFRELVLERLHIEKFVNQVREWQTSTMPQVISTVKDFEDRSRKMMMTQAQDHQVLIELQKSTLDIRRHFKMFHQIATGLDDKPHPSIPDPIYPYAGAAEDTRLPPISSRGGGAKGGFSDDDALVAK